ncbi:MAG TPA: Re/Si-specific NAD(P)(+) transhydrogenase subunit alpha [Candidatus Saccharimonadales bacterium]|jgi:NAD(P) transhydrogenase subunit alpha|nr:Re/Si-specific NAD(P)(+) transhydrogenase subunit alpha [Candidatus Saccharimonadales bacterium]
MRIAVPMEKQSGENRVALVPESVKKLAGSGVEVCIEPGAGSRAGFPDSDYTAVGGKLMDRGALLQGADILCVVNRPEADDYKRLQANAIVIGFLKPLDDPAGLEPAVKGKLTAFAVELVPRITRAQSMDALSSMATISGYKAVIIAAEHLPKMFPLLMTAAGTVPPAKVLVLGAGVAGLMAIATARRLGAVVESYDVRAAAGQDVKSLGAKFLEVDLGGIETQDAGGYAKELSEEALQRGRDMVAKHAALSDLVITTAQIPGRRAPLMLTEAAIASMRPGSVVVDLAAGTGGNCPLTKPGETVVQNGVTIMGPLNLPATVSLNASQLYSRNLVSFLSLIVSNGALKMDMADEILKGACVTYQGGSLHPKLAAALGQPVA